MENKIIEYLDESRELCKPNKELSLHYEKLYLLVDKNDYSHAFNECIELMQNLYRNKDMESYLSLNKVKNILNELNKLL